MERAFAAELFRSDGGHAEVGYGGGADDHGRVGQVLHDGGAHLRGAGDGDEGAAGGRRERSGGGDKDDLRAALAGGFGEGVAHLAAGAVAEKADGVDGLAGASGGDEDGLAVKVLCGRGLQGGEHGLGDGVDVGEAAGAGHAAGEVAAAGFYDGDAAGLKYRDIRTCRRVVPHVHVHRGGDDDRSGGGKKHGGEEVVGEAVGHLGEDVGGGGRDDDRVGGLGLRDVLDLGCFFGAPRIVETSGELALLAPHGGDDFVAGERGEGKRLNELLGGAGHDDADVDFILLQEADEFSGLVGGDSAADSNDYARRFSVH